MNRYFFFFFHEQTGLFKSLNLIHSLVVLFDHFSPLKHPTLKFFTHNNYYYYYYYHHHQPDLKLF